MLPLLLRGTTFESLDFVFASLGNKTSAVIGNNLLLDWPPSRKEAKKENG